MAEIFDFKERLKIELVKVCDNYCKYNQECEEYFNNRPDDVLDYKFDECPIMGLFGNM